MAVRVNGIRSIMCTQISVYLTLLCQIDFDNIHITNTMLAIVSRCDGEDDRIGISMKTIYFQKRV